jgi:hypothetical protein
MGGGNSATLRQAIGGLSNGQPYTFSLYIKQGSGVTAFLDISDTASTVNITPTSEWVRYTYTANWNTSLNFVDIELRGTSGSAFCYIWGAQLEAGSYATSLINTTSSSATRVADLASVPQGTIANFGTGAFCVFLDVNYAKVGITGGIALLGNRQSGDWWRVYGDGTNYYLEINGSNGYTTLLILNGQITSRTKIAFNRNGNNMKVYVNGSSVQNVTNVVYSSDFTTGNSYVEFNAWGNGVYEITTTEYNQAVFFKQSLTATELASLTTI